MGGGVVSPGKVTMKAVLLSKPLPPLPSSSAGEGGADEVVECDIFRLNERNISTCTEVHEFLISSCHQEVHGACQSGGLSRFPPADTTVPRGVTWLLEVFLEATTETTSISALA